MTLTPPTPNWTMVELRGKYADFPSGAPSAGTITFRPRAKRAVDEAALIVALGRDIVVTLDSQGEFVTVLPATDDPDLAPDPFTYEVEEKFAGKTGSKYDIEIPAAAAGTGLDIATIAPRVPTTPVGVTRVQLEAAVTEAKAAAAEARQITGIETVEQALEVATADEQSGFRQILDPVLSATIEQEVGAAVPQLVAPAARALDDAVRAIQGYRNNRVAAVGDSITTADASAPAPNTGTRGTYHVRLALSSLGRIVWGGARASAGFTVEEIVDSRIPALVADKPDAGACIVLAGTNSVNSIGILSGQAREDRKAALLAKLNAGYDALIAAGMRPIACTIPPRENAASTEAAALEWNALVRANAAARGFDLLDFHTLLVATGGNGVWKDATWHLPGDFVHPSPKGHAVMGFYAAGVLAPKMPPRTPQLATVAADPDDTLAGIGLFATDALGTVNNVAGDGISDSWRNFNPAGVTSSRTQDALGVWWQRITNDPTSSGQGLLQANVGSSVSPGDRVRIVARMRTGGLDLGAASDLNALAGFSIQFAGDSSVFGGVGVRADFVREGVFEQTITVPAGATGNLSVNLTLGKPTTGTVWVEFAQIRVVNLTRRGLVA